MNARKRDADRLLKRAAAAAKGQCDISKIGGDQSTVIDNCMEVVPSIKNSQHKFQALCTVTQLQDAGWFINKHPDQIEVESDVLLAITHDDRNVMQAPSVPCVPANFTLHSSNNGKTHPMTRQSCGTPQAKHSQSYRSDTHLVPFDHCRCRE